ncbi:dihydrofolate reductase family protein [Nocardioides taihuensis]|uniref:Dihydrofolate reductase family protein n=1 Tax=Nocardioides taihuensis TaxID=1835606 RepID=A0ABW0BGW8_9ACTN
MAKVIAGITMSLDGYVTGPDDGPGNGLGTGGERLHHWVFGGPWTYATERSAGSMGGADKEFFDSLVATVGGGLVGRGMYDAAGGWGGRNPFPGTLVVLTHRVEDQPAPGAGFEFVSGWDAALARAREHAGDRDVSLGGGADVIRQGLAAAVVDELAVSVAPVVLGAGKRLFEGFTRDLDLEILSVHHSPYAVHTRYRVLR